MATPRCAGAARSARGLDLDAAAALAQRILHAVGGTPAPPIDDTRARATASLGYAPCPWRRPQGAEAAAEADDGAAYDFVISLADAGTYLSKLDGRNRAVGVLRPEDGRGVRLQLLAGPAD